ncbi:HNH endonuclease [Phaeobacter gallaeciensis]|uniref:HNH endonuclease n=1 Tax=Phaeobacter gallaeciensis TaxID=60890 RepID=UPI002852F31F|nr:HNH endonuclease [Phaeobacter gallaeciensis]
MEALKPPLEPQTRTPRFPPSAAQAEFAGEPLKLSRTAQNIRESIRADFHLAPVPDEDIYEASEGRVLTRVHSYRERDRAIVKRKKKSHLKKFGRLQCEACDFDFLEQYGERGEGFIECHHTKPVSDLQPGEKTKLSELVLLCANCHRMVHAARPWWTMEQLRKALEH